MTGGRDDDLLLIPPFVRCMYDAPVDLRFPLASDGMHYPTFDLATQQVVYRFDPPETVAADWVAGPGFSLATWECIRQAEAAWRRSDAAKRAWVTIRRRRAEAAKRLSNGSEIPPPLPIAPPKRWLHRVPTAPQRSIFNRIQRADGRETEDEAFGRGETGMDHDPGQPGSGGGTPIVSESSAESLSKKREWIGGNNSVKTQSIRP